MRGRAFAPDSGGGAATLGCVKANLARAGDPSPGVCFRRFLRQDLARRCAESPHYSLRAYAEHLGIDHATLSQLLRGRRALTARTIAELGGRLRLPAAAIARYQTFAAARGAGDPRAEQVRQLARDAADLVGDPFHFAILELTRIECFEADSRWIARMLDAAVDEVNVALQRLVRLGLLEMRGAREWVDRSGPAVADCDATPAVVLERLLLQVRDLAARALPRAPQDLRLYSSTTLAVDRSRARAVVERLERVRAEVTALLESDARRDDVFQLEISFFPLTPLATGEDHG
jgi:uncharacterized protein (TIGR02147 family)